MEIANYIAKDSIDIALKKMDLIEEKVNTLRNFPLQGNCVPELEDYEDEKYRQIILYPWRVIYSIEPTGITILMVIDGRRNLQDILFKRLMK